MPEYVPGDIGFDPLGLKPTGAAEFRAPSMLAREMMRPSTWPTDSFEGVGEPGLTRAPSSPSYSWSSGETAPLAHPDSPEGPDGAKRSKRCKISREQLADLIKSFNEEPLPNFDQRQALAQTLGMTPRSVQIWFQNRRQRLKPAQPKADNHYGGGRDLSGSSSRTAQQLGMPGLAAAAGLCNGSTSGLDSLMMSHAFSQLPMHKGTPSGSSYSYNTLSYTDVMEPFAATKALLSAGGVMPAGAMALHARSRPASAAGGEPHMGQPMPASYSSASSSAGNQQMRASASCPPSESLAGATPAKSEKADGLLLLLACAGA